MKNYIEAIIEIVLEHITCSHQEIEEYPRGPKQDNVTYGIANNQELLKKCLLIKPETYKLADKEEYIEKMARELHAETYGSLTKCDFQCSAMQRNRIHIRKIVEGKP